MLYVVGFDEKKSPQIYVNAESFKSAFEKAFEWAKSHKYTIISINDYCTESKIEISENCYRAIKDSNHIDPILNKPMIKQVPKDDLSLFGIRHVIKEGEEEKEDELFFISPSMEPLVNNKYDIRGIWRVIGPEDKVIL